MKGNLLGKVTLPLKRNKRNKRNKGIKWSKKKKNDANKNEYEKVKISKKYKNKNWPT